MLQALRWSIVAVLMAGAMVLFSVMTSPTSRVLILLFAVVAFCWQIVGSYLDTARTQRSVMRIINMTALVLDTAILAVAGAGVIRSVPQIVLVFAELGVLIEWVSWAMPSYRPAFANASTSELTPRPRRNSGRRRTARVAHLFVIGGGGAVAALFLSSEVYVPYGIVLALGVGCILLIMVLLRKSSRADIQSEVDVSGERRPNDRR